MKKEKIALVIDSTSGYTKKEAEKMGAFYVPIILTVDGKDLNDGVDITEDELLKKMNPNMSLKTAAPSIGTFEDVYREALKNNDKIFYLGYSHKMSATWNAGVQAGKNPEFDGKIFHPETNYMSAWIYPEVVKLLDMIKKGTTINSMVEVIEKQNEALVGCMTTNTLVYLKNGGRVSTVSAFIGSVAKILPVPVFINGNIDKSLSKKARTWEKAKSKTIETFKEYWDKKEDKSKYKIISLVSPLLSKEEVEEYFNEAREVLGLPKDFKIQSSKMGSAIAAHIGPVYAGLGAWLK